MIQQRPKLEASVPPPQDFLFQDEVVELRSGAGDKIAAILMLTLGLPAIFFIFTTDMGLWGVLIVLPFIFGAAGSLYIGWQRYNGKDRRTDINLLMLLFPLPLRCFGSYVRADANGIIQRNAYGSKFMTWKQLADSHLEVSQDVKNLERVLLRDAQGKTVFFADVDFVPLEDRKRLVLFIEAKLTTTQ